MTDIYTIAVLNESGKEMTRMNLDEFNNIKEYDLKFFKKNEGNLVVKNSFFDVSRQVNTRILNIENKSIKSLDTHVSKVVLILESPHKEEYDENFNPIRIANGSTGVNIKNHILRLLKMLDNKTRYFEVTILNPVPYQTSLNYFTKSKKINAMTRNQFWFFCWWNMDCREKFIKRIKKEKYDIIINACTKDLRHYISDSLKEIVPIENTVAHPSSSRWPIKKAQYSLQRFHYNFNSLIQ